MRTVKNFIGPVSDEMAAKIVDEMLPTSALRKILIDSLVYEYQAQDLGFDVQCFMESIKTVLEAAKEDNGGDAA